MIRLQDALDIVYESLSHTKRSTKSVPIEDALFFINAKSIKATLPLPPFDNSAMDGYGVCGEFERYKVVGKIFAGKTTDQISLDEGEALRIFTGAKVPPSVDTVIPQERVEVDSEDIKVLQPLTLGANIRKCGEDVALDEVILDEGELINSSHIALLASQGISKVEVYTKV
ncbi:MAG: molybdopterin molybdenumtransferase MoeA, partial [Sulfurospirillum sp.]